MEKKENQRVALTKRLLKEGLLQLMEQTSIQKISVSRLCQTAGINRTTFYNHYGSQYDLLREIELDMIADLGRIWQEEEKLSQSLTLRRRTEILCGYFKAHEHTAKLLFRNSDTDSEFAELWFQSALAREGCQREFAESGDPHSQKLMNVFLMNGTYSLIRQWLLDDIPKTPQEMGDLLYNIMVYGWKSAK